MPIDGRCDAGSPGGWLRRRPHGRALSRCIDEGVVGEGRGGRAMCRLRSCEHAAARVRDETTRLVDESRAETHGPMSKTASGRY